MQVNKKIGIKLNLMMAIILFRNKLELKYLH